MSKFTNALIVSPLPDGKRWVLLSNFGYDVGENGSSVTIMVDNGFVTDFTSVPRVLWWIVPRWGKYGNAAVIHDWLYWEQINTRKACDNIFLEAMGVLGTSKIKKWAMYRAVRLLGWMAWKKNARLRARGVTRSLIYSRVNISMGNL